jgi:prepilin-type processing-associated H-X9-DG protein
LLVVIGAIALLLAIMVPPLQLAHHQAKRAKCGANLQTVGVAFSAVHAQMDSDFYPLWDDGGTPTRYTWVDVLLQMGMLSGPKSAYCPEDARPDPLNMARGEFFGVQYPGGTTTPGIDYSYGISVVLSAGGWAWTPRGPLSASEPRVFVNHERNTATRVLVGDAGWSSIYNLSGDALTTGVWNEPSQFDNTVAYWRHPGHRANVLLQDGHVTSLRYNVGSSRPVETQRFHVWYPGESIHVGPRDQYEGNWYPNVPPINLENPTLDDAFRPELVPGYYTIHKLWTRIEHK